VVERARRHRHALAQLPVSIDEPLFDSREGPDEPALPADEARARIARLVEAELYAVLCVQGGGQPYGALVAHAFSEDLRIAVFSTSVATRKYRLLSECHRVALVIDSRPRSPDDLMQIEAVTVTGTATRVEPGPAFERWARLLSSRHAYLKPFVRSASSALYRVDVVRYLHVARFQEVRQWVPTDPS
jgi:nitroimidazol reductase NimA-like FMN-containing flavoprotein (pyridoxamine 5'-phosphate oxidase superfamily)